MSRAGRQKTMSRAGRQKTMSRAGRQKTIGRGWWALSYFRAAGKFPVGVEMRRPAPTLV
jgi:hypothetical protein